MSRLAGALLLLGWLAAMPATAQAADVSFGTPTATAVFGESVTFEQPITASGVRGAEILVTFPASIGPLVTPVPAPAGGSTTLRHALLLSEGHLMPNTKLAARWRVTLDDGSVRVGPSLSITYADDRFTWQSTTGDLMTVHWYEGSTAFGQRALRIGEDAIAKAEDLLGVTETEPVDFFVYADQSAFYDALGPGTRENVGGQANAEIRTLFALITPGEIDDAWVGVVIPHELTHLVFDTAVRNPYNFPPRWLNEGVATYLSQGYDASDRLTVEQAAKGGTLIPLAGLTGQFPTTREGFYLAYAESVSAIDYLIRTYGQDALVSLIKSYSLGRTDDEAFSQALGMDAGEFDAAWFASLGASLPPQVGPQPDPAGPLPSAWTGPAVSPEPGSSGEPAASPSVAPSPTDGAGGGTDGDGGAGLPMAAPVVGLVVVAAVVVGIVVLAMRRSRPSAPPATLPPTGAGSASGEEPASSAQAIVAAGDPPAPGSWMATDTPDEDAPSHAPDA